LLVTKFQAFRDNITCYEIQFEVSIQALADLFGYKHAHGPFLNFKQNALYLIEVECCIFACVSIGARNGLTQIGANPFLEPMLTLLILKLKNMLRYLSKF